MSQQNQQQLVGSNGAGMVNVSRPQPSRSPYEWMKKPSFHSTNVNPGESFNQPPKNALNSLQGPYSYTLSWELELDSEWRLKELDRCCVRGANLGATQSSESGGEGPG
jgi:hypothetical protein